MANFPNPPQPYSLQQIILKILNDCEYAQFIHEQVDQARHGNADAISTVDANFQPQATDWTRSVSRSRTRPLTPVAPIPKRL